MKTYDIFCDASVGPNLRGACAGALVVERNSHMSRIFANIQPNGTNNSGEICALLLGVTSAIAVRNENYGEKCRFNIFSDSIISVRGVREWIFNWIENANMNGNNIFVNTSGKPVVNQFYFKVIFNQIILHNLEVYFYHQPGHVHSHYKKAAEEFFKVNGIPIIRLGLSIEEISTFNNYVDGRTRDILRNFINNNYIPTEGVGYDIVANSDFESIADNMVIPDIRVLKQPPTDTPIEMQSFAVLNGPGVIRKYAKLIHATEYPSRSKILKYIS